MAPAVEQVPQLYSPAASVTARRSSEDHFIAFGVGFAVVFGYRRVLPRFCEAGSYIRYASLGGEYNITATIGSNITVACNNITLTRSAYHFQFDTAFVSTNAVLVFRNARIVINIPHLRIIP